MAVSTADFIDDKAIRAALAEGAKSISTKSAAEIVRKAGLGEGLTLEEVSVLLNIDDKELIEEIYKTAIAVKQKIYGNRLVLFAPLYVSDYCINSCTIAATAQGQELPQPADHGRNPQRNESAREARAQAPMPWKRARIR